MLRFPFESFGGNSSGPSPKHDPPDRLLPHSTSNCRQQLIELRKARRLDADLVTPRVVVFDIFGLGHPPGASERFRRRQRPPAESLLKFPLEVLVHGRLVRSTRAIDDGNEEVHDQGGEFLISSA